jgi:carbon storage regulator
MQSVTIGSDIRVTVIRLEGNQVRIGIEAPRDVRILRDELADGYESAPSLDADALCLTLAGVTDARDA